MKKASNFLRSFLINSAFALFILVISFVGLEIFFRTTHFLNARISWSRPDKQIAWRFAPSKTFWSHDENPEPVIWSTNRFGWKDKEWSVEKSGFRIAVLGDSYVEAHQVDPEENLVSLSEASLNASGLKTEWMNFGRASFTQTEEWVVLQKDIEPFKPDALILFFFPVNDIDEISPETSPDFIRSFYKTAADGTLVLDTSYTKTTTFKIKSLIALIKGHSALVSLMTERFTLFKKARTLRVQRRNAAQRFNGNIQGYLSLSTASPDPQYVKNYALNKQLISQMAAWCRERQIPMLLVVIDTPAYRPKMEEKFKNLDPSFDSLFFENDMKNFAQSISVEFLGLQSVFQKHFAENGRILHWPYGNDTGLESKDWWKYGGHTGHWNEEGHRVAAGALAEKVKSLGWASSPSPA